MHIVGGLLYVSVSLCVLCGWLWEQYLKTAEYFISVEW